MTAGWMCLPRPSPTLAISIRARRMVFARFMLATTDCIVLFLKSFVPVGRLACGRLLCGRLAGSRLAAGRLVLDRLGRLYDLFADFVSDALESVLK